jgi:hypothetical protein
VKRKFKSIEAILLLQHMKELCAESIFPKKLWKDTRLGS